MKKIIVGLLLALAVATPALAVKIPFDDGGVCLTKEKAIELVVTNVPDTTFIIIEDVIHLTSPSQTIDFVLYFENDCLAYTEEVQKKTA